MRIFAYNILWLAAGKAFQVLVAATVGVLVARHLGPGEFGRMNYIIAFVGLFSVVVPLGLPSVLVREIVRDKDAQGRLLSVALGLQGAAAVLIYLLILLIVYSIAPDDQVLLSLAAVYGLTIVSKPADVFRGWFEAEVNMSPVVRMEIIVLTAASIGKLMAIYTSAPMLVFLVIQAVAMSCNSLGTAVVYGRSSGNQLKPAWDMPRAKALLQQSWPLIISAVGLVLYMKIDQVMLGNMTGVREVGIYSAALQLSTIWYAVPVILMSTFFPAIVRAHEADPTQFRTRVSALLDLLVALSISIALIVSFFSTWLVSILYGSAYDGAGPVLALHVWAGVFVFIGVLTGNWYLLAGLQKVNVFRNFLGAALNIALNFWAIPLWGAWGASLATLLSYAAANYFFDYLNLTSRTLFMQKTDSLIFWPRLLFRMKKLIKAVKS